MNCQIEKLSRKIIEHWRILFLHSVYLSYADITRQENRTKEMIKRYVTILPPSAWRYFSREAKLDPALTSMEDSELLWGDDRVEDNARRNLQLFRCLHISSEYIIPLRTRCFETFPSRFSTKELESVRSCIIP